MPHRAHVIPKMAVIRENCDRIRLSWFAYSKGQRVVAQVIAAEGEQAKAVEQLLDRPDVDYIIARDREAGCYEFRVERGAVEASTANGKTNKC